MEQLADRLVRAASSSATDCEYSFIKATGKGLVEADRDALRDAIFSIFAAAAASFEQPK